MTMIGGCRLLYEVTEVVTSLQNNTVFIGELQGSYYEYLLKKATKFNGAFYTISDWGGCCWDLIN